MSEQPGDHAFLRASGARLTPQRMIVLDIMARQPGHITAEIIHQQVLQSQPYCAIATVYRTLQWLQAHGLVARVDMGDGRKDVYEYVAISPHIHLVCRKCGTATQIDNHVLQLTKDILQREHAFSADLKHLMIEGVCGGCQSSDALA